MLLWPCFSFKDVAIDTISNKNVGQDDRIYNENGIV